jgi:hypothetical protein
MTIERRFAVLCQIARAQHFAWRKAVAATCPGVDPEAVVLAMWRIIGEETAAAYLPRLDRTRPLAPQVAAAIAWSSQAMGEDAVALPGARTDEAVVHHRTCPWNDWHRNQGLLDECRRGCDAWFAAITAELSARTGQRLACSTLETLPEGGAGCVRVLGPAPADADGP